MENHESGYEFDAVPRTVESHIQQAVMEYNKIPLTSWYNALGYLSSWASSSDRYKFCAIFHDRFTGDLIANYYPSKESRDNSERPTYQIGAIWRKDSKEYSFHS